MAELVIDKFRELRMEAPEEGERVSSLAERDCLSLHGSRYRGVTWYDRERDGVWLLAVGVHREDSQEDAYAAAAALERAGRLTLRKRTIWPRRTTLPRRDILGFSNQRPRRLSH